MAKLSKPRVLTDQDLIQNAMDCAYEAHYRVFRGGSGLPYIIHPLAVSEILYEWGIEDALLTQAALCHDTIEDNPEFDVERLGEYLEPESIVWVVELTHDKTKVSKEVYLASFEDKSVEALCCKVADRVQNVSDFIVTAPGYAPKYFRKAECLFEIMRKRKSEIIERFGSDTYDSMEYDVMALEQELGD